MHQKGLGSYLRRHRRTGFAERWRLATAVFFAALALFGPGDATAQDVLLVNDSSNQFGEQQAYADALNALGVPFSTWNVAQQQREPPLGVLSGYDAVVWFTGSNRETPGPGSAAEEALETYLNDGGRLFLESHLYHQAAGLTQFIRSYLGVIFFGLPPLQSPDKVFSDGEFNGLGPYPLDCPAGFGLQRASMVPARSADVALRWDEPSSTPVGVSLDAGEFRSVYTALPLSCLSSVGERAAVLERALEFFGFPVNPPSSGSPDPFEPNDTPETATVAPVGLAVLGIPTQLHTLDYVGDVDWLKFLADVDSTYVFTVNVAGGSAQIAFELLDADFNVLQRVVSGDLRELVIRAGQLEGRHYLKLVLLSGFDPGDKPLSLLISGEVINPVAGAVHGFVLDASTCMPAIAVDVEIENEHGFIKDGETGEGSHAGRYIILFGAGDVVDVTAALTDRDFVAATVHAYLVPPQNSIENLDFRLQPNTGGEQPGDREPPLAEQGFNGPVTQAISQCKAQKFAPLLSSILSLLLDDDE